VREIGQVMKALNRGRTLVAAKGESEGRAFIVTQPLGRGNRFYLDVYVGGRLTTRGKSTLRLDEFLSDLFAFAPIGEWKASKEPRSTLGMVA
jgi:hypothetical protein